MDLNEGWTWMRERPDYGKTGFMNELSDLNLAMRGVGRKTFFIKRCG